MYVVIILSIRIDLGGLHHHTFPWSSLNCFRHLWSKPVNGRCLSFSPSLTSSNKYIGHLKNILTSSQWKQLLPRVAGGSCSKCFASVKHIIFCQIFILFICFREAQLRREKVRQRFSMYRFIAQVAPVIRVADLKPGAFQLVFHVSAEAQGVFFPGYKHRAG